MEYQTYGKKLPRIHLAWSGGLVGTMLLLTLAGTLLPQDESLAWAVIFAAAWFILSLLAVRKTQWVPLLLGTIYWVPSSALRLYLSDPERRDMTIHPFLSQWSDLAARALLGLSSIHQDLVLLGMAALTLASLIGLIMVLDREKPREVESKDKKESDLSEWF